MPVKIKFFMGLFSHGRANMAQLQAKRDISDTGRCPFGCEQDEDLMLRDCKCKTMMEITPLGSW